MRRARRQNAVVLLSAGLDSSYNLMRAIERFKVPVALTFNYGQRAARREIERATKLARKFKVPHRVVDVPWFKDFTRTSLVGSASVPTGGEIAIDDRKASLRSAKRVWVPNRNGILLNIAAGYAEGVGAAFIIPGFNAEEARTFPDNSSAFMQALDKSLSFSTANGVKAFCFSTKKNKTEIVKDGIRLGLPLHMLWPCYFAGRSWCGRCESCQRYARALAANGLSFEELR